MQILTDILQKKFVGTDDLRKNLTKILKMLPKEKEIIITQHGVPKAVLIDPDYYSKIQNELTPQKN